WVASYSGDANNEGVSSGCADEPVVVGPAAPSIKTTQLPGSGDRKSTRMNTGHGRRSYAAHALESMSWKVCAEYACEGYPVGVEGPVLVSGDGDYDPAAGAVPTRRSSDLWVASYSGDANNEGVSSGCADEPVVVGPAAPSIKTTQLPGS